MYTRSQTATGLCFKMIMITFQIQFQKTVLVLQLRLGIDLKYIIENYTEI